MGSMVLSNGSTFAGRYHIVRRIAQGGMGAVYEAKHTETERSCALKVMLPLTAASEDLRDRFRQEARIIAKIRSAFIVDVLDAGIDEVSTMPFIVMELLHGEELGHRINRIGRLPSAETVAYGYQLAAAIDKIHESGIIHRDLKPSNIFLCRQADDRFTVKIIDFGIAKVLTHGMSGAVGTQAIGTPLYMAPEQFRIDRKITPAIDIFAFGMIIYACLTGKAYWAGETPAEEGPYAIIAMVMGGPKEAPSARAARSGVVLPLQFDDWFAAATCANPAGRFASALVAVQALEQLLNSSAETSSSILLTTPFRAARSRLEPERDVVRPSHVTDPSSVRQESTNTSLTRTTQEPTGGFSRRARLLALGTLAIAGGGALLNVAIGTPASKSIECSSVKLAVHSLIQDVHDVMRVGSEARLGGSVGNHDVLLTPSDGSPDTAKEQPKGTDERRVVNRGGAAKPSPSATTFQTSATGSKKESPYVRD